MTVWRRKVACWKKSRILKFLGLSLFQKLQEVLKFILKKDVKINATLIAQEYVGQILYIHHPHVARVRK